MAAKRDAVVHVPLPEGSLVARAFDRIDYADAFKVALPPHAPATVDALTRQLLISRPKWIDGLMGARDLVVGMFGLKGSMPRNEDLPTIFAPGTKLGLFEVFERTSEEVLLGADDRHLDFRASILLLKNEGGRSLIMSTVVRFNNVFGRIYFTPVKPFHKMIVRSMLERLVSEPRQL